LSKRLTWPAARLRTTLGILCAFNRLTERLPSATEVLVTDEPQAGSAFGRVQGVAGVLVAMVGALYAIGLLIVNIDLGRYGLTSLNLARAEYAMAGGLWALLTLAVNAAFDAVVGHIRREWAAGHRVWTVVHGILDVLVVLSTLTFVLALVSGGDFMNNWRTALIIMWALILSSIFVGTAVSVGQAVAAQRPFHISTVWGFGTRIPNAVYSTALVLASVALYSTTVFPAALPAFGGGKKPLVLIVLSPSADIPASTLGLTTSADGRVIGPVALLLDQGDFLLVRRLPEEEASFIFIALQSGTTRRNAVALDKKSISAVSYNVMTEATASGGTPKAPEAKPSEVKPSTTEDLQRQPSSTAPTGR
jgi:hypothetical protein